LARLILRQITAGRDAEDRNLEIGLLDPQTALDVGHCVNGPGAEAVMLACGNWSTFSIIDQLEYDLGKPVLTTNQVSLWHALKMMDTWPLGGPGILLRHHPGDEAARHAVRAVT
jgi:maleate cis-trans isomerase